MDSKFKVGDKVLKGKKVLIVERIYWSKIRNKFYYSFKNYHLWFYENEIKEYKEEEQ